MTEFDGDAGIAIVGMAGRFPGAPDVDTLWSNLCAGVESIRPLDDAELRSAGIDSSEPGYVNATATLDGAETFDAAFFGMTRREAELTDPQHRILLETVWNTLEHAGHQPGGDAGRIGLFGGVAENYYFRYNVQAHPDLLAKSGFYPIRLAGGREYAIMKTAFKLGLTGPAISVMTACSTSAVATHLGVQSLLAGDCDLAVAGGAHLFLPGRHGYVYQEGGILSPDGHVRAFDAQARGTVMASGVAFIALRRVADAIADGDTIYAVIRGAGVNNDGAVKVGFTAPGLGGQRAVIEDALAVAGVDAASVSMLEAHGTGTSLGDPIEVEALTEAYRRHTSERGFCALGSIKSNIGHLDAAAGAAGIIKAALSLHHGRIPPSINFSAPNPQIDFEASPFFVNTEVLEWPRTDVPRRAGVSSFGFGGTNAHIVLEEAPLPPPLSQAPDGRSLIVTLSARSAEALDRRKVLLADHLAAHPGTDYADTAYTLVAGRSRMPHRSAVVATDAASAAELLRDPRPGASVSRNSAVAGAEVAFCLTGQGAQYLGMGKGLYDTEPAFRSAIDECAAIVGELDGHGLIDLLYGSGPDTEAAASRILHTDIGQPVIFALQYALARLWESWGVRPAALVGHSVGEIAAACLGGMLSLEDALGLAVVRGRLMADLPRGAMTAVLAEQTDVEPYLGDEVSLAAINAPAQCVASGHPDSVSALEQRLDAAGIAYRRLPTDRAFHSPMMEPVMAPLRDHVASLPRGQMTIPMVSTMTGAWLTPEALAEPAYWSHHARRTVRFMDAVGVLLEERPDLVIIEVGPGNTLASLVRQHPSASADNAVISTLPHHGDGADDATHARLALAAAWTAGVEADLVAANGGRRHRLPLPTYPFSRERHWIAGDDRGVLGSSSDAPIPEPVTATTTDGMATRDVASGAVASGAVASRVDRIREELAAILVDLSGLEQDALEPTASFTELGFDSLFLTQANAQFRSHFGVQLTLGQLLGETPTIASLAQWIDAELAPEPVIDAELAAEPAKDRDAHGHAIGGNGHTSQPHETTAVQSTVDGGLEALIMEQLQIMDEQLEVLRSQPRQQNGR